MIEFASDRECDAVYATIPPYETAVIYTHTPLTPAPGFKLADVFERADAHWEPSVFYKWVKR